MSLNNTQINFPVYRKLQNLDVYYKIISYSQFEEIKKMGEKYLFHSVHAIQFPEKLLIQDMISLHENRYEELSENVFSELKNKCS